MKQLTTYISEKANFIVKKHVKHSDKPGTIVQFDDLYCVCMGYDGTLEKDVYITLPCKISHNTAKNKLDVDGYDIYEIKEINSCKYPDSFQIPDEHDSFIERMISDKAYADIYYKCWKDNIDDEDYKNFHNPALYLKSENKHSPVCVNMNKDGAKKFHFNPGGVVQLVLYTTR